MSNARPNRTPIVPPGGIEHHVTDLTATFAADVTLAAARDKLAKAGQWLPIDGGGHETLGVLVERNSTGPLRLGFGGWRDLLLGAQFTNGAGELITAGGRAVKNVAGYDLTKFMVGQFGIFGRVVTLTTRTYKRPTGAALATFEPDVRRLNAMLTTPARPQWALLTREALRCGYLGDERTIAFYEKTLPQLEPREWTRQSLEDDIALRERLWTASDEGGANGRVGFRASVPPMKLQEFAANLDRWVADAAFGIVIGSTDVRNAAAIREAARQCGGSVVLLDSSGKPLDPQLDPAVNWVLERLKYAFDPDGRLNPLSLKEPGP
jgi:FAD/FMN-containing dehydrogenase